MANAPIQSQIGPGASIPSGLTSITNPIYPPQTLLFRLRSFPSEVYKLSPSSHLLRLLGVLLGDAGGEQIRKQGLINRLRGNLTSTHFLDMDGFWGALFSLNRGPGEGLPYNPSTGVTVNPYLDSGPPALWSAAHQADSYYRSRVMQFVEAISYGSSPVGIKKVAEAVLGMTVDLYETFQETPANFLATISPHGIITQADIYNLYNILGQIKPADAIINITQGIGAVCDKVLINQAWASSSMWEVHALIIPGPNSLFQDLTTRPRYAFSGYQGEMWTLTSSVRTIGSQSWDAAGNVISTTDFEHYLWPDGTFTNFSPDLSVQPAWLSELGRLAQSGVSSANPLNPSVASPVLFDGMSADGLSSLISGSSLVSQNMTHRYWSTPARLGSDQTQDVITYNLDQPHYLNQVNFEVANYPHTAQLWTQDTTSGSWNLVYTYSNASASPEVFTDPTVLLSMHQHPQHSSDNAWVPVTVRLATASIQNIKIVLQRFVSSVPLSVHNAPAPYSLGIKNFSVSSIIDSNQLLPVMGGAIDSALNLVGDRVSYESYIENPNQVINDKNSISLASLAQALNAGNTYTSIELTLSNQTIYAGSYIIVGGQQVKVIETASGTGSITVPTVTFTVAITYPSGEQVTVSNPQWRCSPQPSKSSVVNFYLDMRATNPSGAVVPQVIDALYIEPTHNGVTANLYWTNDVPVSGTAVDEFVQPTVVGTVTPSISGITYSPTPDGSGNLAQTSFTVPFITPSWWAGVAIVPSEVSSSDLLTFGPFTLSYNNNATQLTFTVGGISTTLTLGPLVIGNSNVITLGFISSTDSTDLGSVGQNGLVVFGVNGTYQTSTLIGQLGTSTTWAIGGQTTNSFRLTNMVIKGEPLTSSTANAFMASPNPFCYKGQFKFQDTGMTNNAYLRFDPSFILPGNPYGFLGGTPDGMSGLQWMPITQDFILSRGNLSFRPTLANFWKIEMTNLVAEPMSVFLPQIQVSTQLAGTTTVAPQIGQSNYQGAVPVGVTTEITNQQGQPAFPATTPPITPPPNPQLLSPTQALVANTPLLAQSLATKIPSFGYTDWTQSPVMGTDVSGGSENYIAQNVNHIQQLGFFCGFYTIQATRSNIASQTDTPVYFERFLDQQNFNL